MLGPILFLVYINSVFHQQFRGKITAFADDLGMSYAAQTQFELVSDINHDVEILRKWFVAHKLTISNKTRIMYVSLTQLDIPQVNIRYHDPNCKKFNLNPDNHRQYSQLEQCHPSCFDIESVESFKYLGVIIDRNLKWAEHTLSIKSYLRATIRKMYELRNFCSSQTLKMVYYGLFHSKLNYGITCWGGAYFNKLDPLLKLQKCAIRLICNANRRHPSITLFKSLNILPIRHQYFHKVLKTFILKNSHHVNRSLLQYNLRYPNNVPVPPFRTTSYRNSYAVLSCRLFNKLPNVLKCIYSPNSFLKNLKIWLLNFNHLDIEILLDPFV